MRDVSILTNNEINVQQGLELFGDMEMYNETLTDFLSMVADKLNHLENTKSNDMPNYAIEVHSLKSDARYLGFTTLADLSYQSELKSKANDVTFVLENHPKIIKEAKRVIAVAQQYLGVEVKDLVPNIVCDDEKNDVVVEQNDVVVEQNVVPNVINESNIDVEKQNNISIKEQEMLNSLDLSVSPKKGIILVIDDSDLVSKFVNNVFSEFYDVKTATDGNEGIRMIMDPEIGPKVKACLLDLNMPNMNGFQVMNYFNEQGVFVKTPVAVISGIEDPETIEKAKTYPIIDILSKPFSVKDIQRVVEECLATYF